MFNKGHLEELTIQVCEAWEYPIPTIVFQPESVMENTVAFVLMKGGRIGKEIIDDDFLCFSEYLLSCNIDFIMKIIYHEIGHLITKKGDQDPEFQMFCKLNNIPLSREV